MEIIALVNVKGGVGKTTTTVNAAHALARSGRQVLVVDFDPQGNATTCLGIDCANRYTVLDLIRSTAKVDEVFTDPIPGVRLLPADLGLADAELAVGAGPGREHRLQAVLEPLRDEFNYCLIDCPPTMGFFTVNAMVAADYYILPAETQYLPMRGISVINNVVAHVKKYLHEELIPLGVLATKYDRRRSLDNAVLDLLRSTYGNVMFETVIRTCADLAGATAMHQTIYDFAPSSSGATDYTALCDEIIDRTGGWA